MDYDLAIIGGGIHGVGVAQAAAVKGYKTLLLEQYDHLAEGTSSRSSKLIHGGLRYLEQFELSLVRECLFERSYLLKNAPDLVKLTPVYIPVYRNSNRTPWMIRAGLSLYSILGNVSRDTRFKKINKNQWHELNGLEEKNLLAVYQYYEAQTDDRLLTQAVMNSAQEFGAELKLSTEVKGIQLNKDHCSINCLDNNSDELVINSSTIVNTAGPWAQDVLNSVIPQQKNIAVDLVQGSHIILSVQMGNVIFYIESPEDNRPLFVMPWYGNTMIGTTESVFYGDPSETFPQEHEVNYLLEAFYHYFPEYKNKKLEIESKFSGLRVLPKSKKDANKRSRETIYLRDRKYKPRMISIFGGKLTAYRATAEHVLARFHDSLPKSSNKLNTKEIKLTKPH